MVLWKKRSSDANFNDDDDDDELSPEELTTLNHASMTSHASIAYPQTSNSSRSATPTATGAFPVERLLTDSSTVSSAQPQRQSSRSNPLKRLSRLVYNPGSNGTVTNVTSASTVMSSSSTSSSSTTLNLHSQSPKQSPGTSLPSSFPSTGDDQPSVIPRDIAPLSPPPSLRDDSSRPTQPPFAVPIHAAPGSPQFRRPSTAASPLLSPASSMIFERSVQDFNGTDAKLSGHAGHSSNEDFIPPVLTASTEAIIDANLDPEDVDVISLRRPSYVRSHSISESASSISVHSPTRCSTSGSGIGGATPILSSSMCSGPPINGINGTSSPDRHVLSFYSFADIVSSENVASHTNTNLSSGGKLSPLPNRSPSPENWTVPAYKPENTTSSASAHNMSTGISNLSLSMSQTSTDSPDGATVASMGETLRRNTGEISGQVWQ